MATSAVTRAEKVIIIELVVEADASRKSFVWQYYVSLHRKSDIGTDVIDN